MHNSPAQDAPKPYPNLINAVADGLTEVFYQGYYADRVVAQLLKRDVRWGSRDRAFIAETLYDCVRWWRLLSFIAEDERSEAVVAAYWAWKFETPLDLGGYPIIHPKEVSIRLALARGNRALLQSIPDWIDEVGFDELGDQWKDILPKLNEQAEVFLRVNTLKTDLKSLQKELQSQGIQTEIDERGKDALRIVVRRNLWATKAFQAGHFEVQDIASQQVAAALHVEPGMTVIDACAGAGGKTLHLASLMKNKGRLIAMDIHPKKLDELKKRAKRAGVSNLETRLITGTKAIKRMYGKADRVLMDVPCSGLGVLRRNPDAKWKLRPEFLEEVRITQSEIIEQYSRMAKAHGEFVYATCSILPSESEQQVAKFLEGHVNWKKESQLRFSPIDGYDGFYLARMTPA